MTCVHHYGIIQSIFTGLKILHALSMHSVLPNTQLSLIFFYCFISFAVSRTSQSGNHAVCSFFRLASLLSNTHLSIMNKAAIQICGQFCVGVWGCVCVPKFSTPLSKQKKSMIPDSYGKSSFVGNKLSSEVAVPSCFPPSNEREFLILHILVSIQCCQCSRYGVL